MTCSVKRCGRPVHVEFRQLCRTHADRQREGQPDWDRPILKRRDGWTISERLMDQRQLELVVPMLGECWRFTGHHDDGYGITVDDRRKRATIRVHIAAYREWVGGIPDELCVRHKCDVRDCFRPDHLILGTVAENNNDAKKRGRIPLGIQKWGAKLTDDDVRAIRTDARRVGVIAREYGVSSTTVSLIRSRKKRTSVEDR